MTNLCRFHRDLLSVEGDFTVRRPSARTFILVNIAKRYGRNWATCPEGKSRPKADLTPRRIPSGEPRD